MKSSSSNSSSSSENLFDYATYIGRAGADHRGRDDHLFVCTGGPLSPHRIEIPRYQTELVQQHKASCEKCIEQEKQRLEEQQLRLEGPKLMQYCLYRISEAKSDIRYAKDKKEEIENRKARGEGEEISYIELQRLKNAEYDAGAARQTIRKEREELHKLINHPNEIIRAGANKTYANYLQRLMKIKNSNNRNNKKK